jgi:hypothetical protein
LPNLIAYIIERGALPSPLPMNMVVIGSGALPRELPHPCKLIGWPYLQGGLMNLGV